MHRARQQQEKFAELHRQELTTQQALRDYNEEQEQEEFRQQIRPFHITRAHAFGRDDIADVAVAELLRRDRAPAPLPGLTLDLVGPQVLTGASAARVWSTALGREVVYGGDDVAGFEAQMAGFGPAWLAYDMRLMMAGIQRHGMLGGEGAVEQLQAILGRPLRTYESYVQEATSAG